MVYGVAFCPESKKEQLKNLGVDGSFLFLWFRKLWDSERSLDSKKLTEEQRDAFFDQICAESDWLGWTIRALTPRDISWAMLRRHKYNLNALSHDTAIDLIRHTLNQGVRLTEACRQINAWIGILIYGLQIYVDTVGPPDKYQSKLEGLFPGIKITVSKGADHLFPIVSAASICAKVGCFFAYTASISLYITFRWRVIKCCRTGNLQSLDWMHRPNWALVILGIPSLRPGCGRIWTLYLDSRKLFAIRGPRAKSCWRTRRFKCIGMSSSFCVLCGSCETIVSRPLEDEEDTADVELYPGQKRKQQTTLDSFTGQKKSTETTRPPMYSSMCHVSDFWMVGYLVFTYSCIYSLWIHHYSHFDFSVGLFSLNTSSNSCSHSFRFQKPFPFQKPPFPLTDHGCQSIIIGCIDDFRQENRLHSIKLAQ